MTILGVVAISAEVGVAWSDTACFAAGTAAPTGHAPKLTLNPLACVAGAGAGWGVVAIEGANALIEAIGLDELASDLPAKLRRAAFRAAPQMERLDPGSFASCTFAAVGWSRQFGRMLVFEFAALSAFEPRLTTAVCIPELPPRVVPAYADWFCICDAAEHQMREFRRMAPETDGQLVAAVIRPGSIETKVLLDFAAGVPAR